jgi:calcium-dependent protein kinase
MTFIVSQNENLV